MKAGISRIGTRSGEGRESDVTDGDVENEYFIGGEEREVKG